MTISTKSLKTYFAQAALIAMALSIILMPRPVSSGWLEDAARKVGEKITEARTEETVYTCHMRNGLLDFEEMRVIGVGQTQTTAMLYAKEAVCALFSATGQLSTDDYGSYDQEQCTAFQEMYVSSGCTSKTFKIPSADTPSAYRCKAHYPMGATKQTGTGTGPTMVQAKEEAYNNVCALNGNPEGCRMGSWIESCTWGKL